MILAALVLLAILLVSIFHLVRRARRGATDVVPIAQVLAPARPAVAVPMRICRTVRVYFIKPSKYDDRGRVQHFWKGVLPNNTLTVLAALNDSYNRLRADEAVYVETVIWDEQVDGPILAATIRAIQEKALEDGVEVIIGLAGVQTNQDGGVTVWFAPSAPAGHEKNWVQTMPGKGYSVLLRLYGPLEPWFNQSWRPGDFELQP